MPKSVKATKNPGKPGKRRQAARPSIFYVRLSEEAHEGLKAKAQANGRSLMGEMEKRLEASLAPAVAADLPDPTIYGWSAPERAIALSTAIASLTGATLDYLDADPARALALVRVAIDDLLNGLGAAPEIDERLQIQARTYAQQLITDMRRVEPDPSAYSQKPYLAMIAATVKAWGRPGEQNPSPAAKGTGHGIT